jgi:hypothetical protein
MLIEEPPKKEISPTRGWRTKWEKEKKVHLGVVKELQKIQEFENKSIEVEMSPTNLELAKLFFQLGGLNWGMPLGMTKEVYLPSSYKGSIELTNQYAKLARANIPTKVDTSTGKVNLMKANES